ncbi:MULTISPECIES: hypothetical protein [Myxococcus]|uniref:hypothetical protein n=1 Tax=Myxococcus TaxID=32 RepID=UPI001143B8F3|nr:hypothetical protein [Myxococcus sp. AB025B]MCK8496219.1 hypothetical protein [Myxococcus fulvus]
MKRSLPLLACTLLAGSSVVAKERSTFKYTAPPDGERPVIVDAVIAPQGSDFAMRLRFDKEPWGEECKNRCANATLLIDADSSKQTGLKLTAGAPGNGADLAVIIQGVREYATESGKGAKNWLRVKVRLLNNEASSVDDGELLAELSHKHDTDRIQSDGKTVYLLVDSTHPSIPAGRKARVVYQPPGGKPIQANVTGLIGGGGSKGNVKIFKDGNWGKAPKADP